LELDPRDAEPLEVLGLELDPPLPELDPPLPERERPLDRDCALAREEPPDEPRPPLDALPERARERLLVLRVARLVDLLLDERRFVLALFCDEVLFVSPASARSCADRWLEVAIVSLLGPVLYRATPLLPHYNTSDGEWPPA
jgi:hypothetical protein